MHARSGRNRIHNGIRPEKKFRIGLNTTRPEHSEVMQGEIAGILLDTTSWR